MPWCPQCWTEYRDGYTHCTDCDVPLQDQPPENDAVPVYNSCEMLLASFDDSFMAQQAEALLKDNGVSVMRISPGTGSYMEIYMGRSMYGADLYVPSDEFERAQELMNDLTPATIPQEVYDYPDDPEPLDAPIISRQTMYRIFAWLMLLAFLPTALESFFGMQGFIRRLFGH